MSALRRPRASVVLGWLLRGHPVTVGARTFVYEGGLCVQARRYGPGEDPTDPWGGTPTLLGADLSVDAFVALCEGMSEEDYLAAGFAAALRRDRY